MYKRGSQMLIDSALQALGIHTRDDIDLLCHRELRLEINTYLHLSSTQNKLIWVAANPDGERRKSADLLCFWYPKHRALSLVAKLVAPTEDTFEYRFKKYVEYFKQFRAAQYVKLKYRKEVDASDCLREKLLERNVYLWRRSLASARLTWIDSVPFNGKRAHDVTNLWRPKSVSIGCLNDLHNPNPNSFEEEFNEISSYIRGFRTAAQIKIELVKEQLKQMWQVEQAQMQLKLC